MVFQYKLITELKLVLLVTVFGQKQERLLTITFFGFNGTLDDLDAASDDVDYPQEWFNAIALGLALRIADKYGKKARDLENIRQQFASAYTTAYGYDDEEETQFVVNFRGNDY